MNKYGLSIKWLSVSCYEIRYEGHTIVTDPYETNGGVEACDMVCLSHSHWDHLEDLPQVAEKFDPIILCGDKTAYGLAEWLDRDPAAIYPMYPDNELDFGWVKVRAIYGRHKGGKGTFSGLRERLNNNPACQNDPGLAAIQLMGSMEYRNFLLTFSNGTKLLIWGGDPTVDQKNLCAALGADIAIIQRSKDEAKADFAAALGCKILLPHHQHFRKDDSELLAAMKEQFLEKAPGAQFIDPDRGEWIEV